MGLGVTSTGGERNRLKGPEVRNKARVQAMSMPPGVSTSHSGP